MIFLLVPTILRAFRWKAGLATQPTGDIACIRIGTREVGSVSVGTRAVGCVTVGTVATAQVKVGVRSC